ncbi:MAG: tRNA methyl transferase PRC-barrel domain-containing protein [Evtepia gabavorous]
MLARLPQHWLSRLVFPIGGYEKTQVRQLARDFGLPVAEKPDSMEICFIPDGDYAAWLEARGAVPPPGHFVDRTGRVLGRHRGIHRYTIGQRRGWVSRRPTGCLSRRSARRPRRWSSPTARTLWRTRSGGRTLTRWPL